MMGLRLANVGCAVGKRVPGDGGVRVEVGELKAREPVMPRGAVRDQGVGLQTERIDPQETAAGLEPALRARRRGAGPSPAKAVIPAAFAKFDDIAWVDVCQERAGTPDGVDDATPVTRLEVNRHDSATVDWKKFDLVSLLALKHRSQHDVSILANDGVEQTRAWRAALSQSGPLDC
jgi:hypothetical protein